MLCLSTSFVRQCVQNNYLFVLLSDSIQFTPLFLSKMLLLNHYTLILLFLTTLHSQNLTNTFQISNPKGPNYQNTVEDCMRQLLLRYFVPYRYLLAVVYSPNLTSPTYEIEQHLLRDINIQSRWFLQMLQTNENDNCSSQEKPSRQLREENLPRYKSKYVLIITDSFENFLVKLEHVVSSKSFDLRAKVLVYISASDDIVKDVTEALRMRKIYIFLVVIPTNNQPKLQAYCLNLYVKAKTCGDSPKTELVYACDKSKLITKKYIFDYGMPKDFHYCKIEAITVKYPPFVIDQKRGFETKLIRELGTAMKINFTLFLDNETTSWGSQDHETKEWNGRLGYVLNKSAIGFGSVQYSAKILKDFDFTTGYFYEHIIWVVPSAEAFPQWQCLFQILTFKACLASIASYIVGTIVVYLVSFRREREAKVYKSILDVATIQWQVYTANSTRVLPLTFQTRIVFCSVVIATLILAAVYQSSLIYPLTHTIYYEQIKTLQGILDSGLAIGGLLSYKEFFNLTSDVTSMKIYNTYQNKSANDTAHYWLKAVNDDKHTATLLGEFYAKFLVANATAGEYRNVFITKENLMFYPVHIVLPKGFPLRDRIDTIINRMIQGGLVDKWMLSYTEKLKEFDTLKMFMSEYKYKMPITIDKIQGAFVLLIIGYLFAAVVLVLEMFFYQFIAKKEKKNARKRSEKRQKKK